MRAALRLLVGLGFSISSLVGCSEGDEAPPQQGIGSGATGGFAGAFGVSGSGGNGGNGGTGGGGSGGSAGSGGTSGSSGTGGSSGIGGAGGNEAGGGGTTAGSAGQGGSGGTEAGKCPVTFSVTVPAGAQNPRVAGEWNNFNPATATPLTPGSDGKHQGTVALPPGLHGYKVIYEQGGQTQWVLDPDQGRRKYLGGIENSAVKVRDCALPSLTVTSTEIKRLAPGQGSFSAKLSFTAGIGGDGAAPEAFELTLRSGGKSTPLAKTAYQVDTKGHVTISLNGLADGKYRVTAVPVDKSGKKGEPLLLPFWIEAEPFQWEGALIYMVMTDRFRDGDPKNNGPQTPGAEPTGDFQGGDLEGLRQAIAEGVLDKLGVHAIWLTPFQTNPQKSYLAADGVHKVTGYHGYWPVKGREVDPRLGGPDALHALVEEAHQHGIRILQDYVVNHVHEEHEYFKEHPEWFRTGCVCGTAGCDWTEKALECLFAPYMPDINHTVPEANARFVDDAVYWLDEFDLDGLRVDAVKHVEEVATRNLAVQIRESFENAGTKYFLMGETAMGWGDCPDPCNDENYNTIARYIGPYGLDGQFDFVLYHGVSYRVFASYEKGMLHADYWTDHGQKRWPKGAIMTPYIGSHDTPRFVTLADPDNAWKAGIQWGDIAKAPNSNLPLQRLRVAMAWMMGLPGAPLLYYGDEYGQWGGADPNNRLFWRDESKLSTEEKNTLAFVQKLGQARRAIPALRRGSYVPYNQLVDQKTVGSSTLEDVLVFGRKAPDGKAAIVGVNRSGIAHAMIAQAQSALGLSPGTVLKDALGGPGATVDDTGKVKIVIPAFGAVMLAPLR
ncbi:MAG: alpha-amylase family glycosyl hydrolase [Myxococcales bacterium]|nr:alpha-amylase family glycosyl hydrolase [Polyangiaceae bacterium]MDW8251451.1 alpha-amylase family glycosyl hydrolase [Myxococcales bacterium]